MFHLKYRKGSNIRALSTYIYIYIYIRYVSYRTNVWTIQAHLRSASCVLKLYIVGTVQKWRISVYWPTVRATMIWFGNYIENKEAVTCLPILHIVLNSCYRIRDNNSRIFSEKKAKETDRRFAYKVRFASQMATKIKFEKNFCFPWTFI